MGVFAPIYKNKFMVRLCLITNKRKEKTKIMIINAIKPYVKTQNYTNVKRTVPSFGRRIDHELEQMYKEILERLGNKYAHLNRLEGHLKKTHFIKDRIRLEGLIQIAKAEIAELERRKADMEKCMFNR